MKLRGRRKRMETKEIKSNYKGMKNWLSDRKDDIIAGTIVFGIIGLLFGGMVYVIITKSAEIEERDEFCKQKGYEDSRGFDRKGNEIAVRS